MHEGRRGSPTFLKGNGEYVISEILSFSSTWWLQCFLLTAYFSATLRLSNGTDKCSGRVEVYHNDRWGKICNNNWGYKEALVVCRELSCGTPKKYQETFNFGESGLRAFTSACSGNVSSIAQCSLQEYSGTCTGVSISCTGNTQKDKIDKTAVSAFNLVIIYNFVRKSHHCTKISNF